jgi:hypothetical protein
MRIAYANLIKSIGPLVQIIAGRIVAADPDIALGAARYSTSNSQSVPPNDLGIVTAIRAA